MQIVNNYLSAWKNAFVYTGRARRSEYWYFVLANVIVGFVLGSVSAFVDILTILTSLYSLAVIFPAVSLGIRRLHDVGKSGWFYLFVLIPVVGGILLLVWFCTDSTPGPNQYGPNPKGYDPAYQQGYQPGYQPPAQDNNAGQGPEL